MVKLEVFDGITGLGLNVLVAPLGKPDMFKVTGELNPFSEVTKTINDAESPRVTV